MDWQPLLLYSGMFYARKNTLIVSNTLDPHFTSYYQVSVGEHIFSLHQSSSVSRVEKIKDPISVDANWTVSCK